MRRESACHAPDFAAFATFSRCLPFAMPLDIGACRFALSAAAA